MIWYPATSWYPQKQHLLLLEPHWLTLVLGPEHGFHTLYYLWTQNLKDPSGSVFLAKIVKKCVLLTKNSILDKGISLKMPHRDSGENRFFDIFWQFCLILALFLVVKIG